MNQWKLHARRMKKYPRKLLIEVAKKEGIKTVGTKAELVEEIVDQRRECFRENWEKLLRKGGD